MRVDHLAARVTAALARDDHEGPPRVALLAALSRDTPAFGGATTVAPPRTRSRWSGPPGLTALLRRTAAPTGRPSPPPARRPRTLAERLTFTQTAPPTPAPRPSTPADGPSTPADRSSRPADRSPINHPFAERPSTSADGSSIDQPFADRPSTDRPSTSVDRPSTSAARASMPADRPSTSAEGSSMSANRPSTPARPSTPVERSSTSADRSSRAADRPPTFADRASTSTERSSADRPGRGDGPPRQAKRDPWPPPLFSMPDPTPSRRMPSSTTRRLCAAVHLDADLARRVVAELTDDPRRAVPPSVGFDLEPVLCHALRARLLTAARDGFLTVMVLVALVLAPRTTVAVLLLGAAAGLCRVAPVRAVPPAGRALFAAALVFGLVAVIGAALTVLGAAAPVSPGTGELDRIAAAVGAPPGPRVWVAVAVLVVGAAAGHLAHLWWTGVTLAAATLPVPLRAATAGRVAVVAAAQRGNVAFSRTDPFVGAGPRARAWSVAVALRATDSGGYRPRSPATLDPVLLRRHVGQALQGLGDGGAGHAGLPGLAVAAYLAADGVRCAGDPLLDGGTPLPLASREALDAVVRSPREGLRHYDRVVVVPRARGVTTAEGRPVVPSEDGDGHVSVFVHTSIEASVVYVELSAHVLPPIRTSCYVSPAPVVHLELLTQLTGAPWRLTRTAAHRLRAAAGQAQRDGWHDHSARLGVRDLARELAREQDGTAALAALDATKYVKIVERVVVEAVADFLERYDLDATTFRAEVPTAG